MTLKFGVIGTGAMGREHIKRITKRLSGGEVTAITDISKGAINKTIELGKQIGIAPQVYKTGEELIADSDVDAIIITNLGEVHEQYNLAGIAAGKYVFSEKPLADTAVGCRRIVDAEMKAGRHLLQVGFMRRFDAGYKQLKKAIDAGEIGRPLIVHCAHRNPDVDEHYTTSMAITDTLIHEIDVLHWLINDDYKSVHVMFPKQNSYARKDLRDPQLVTITTKSGIVIDAGTFVTCQYGYDIRCNIVGEKGVIGLPEVPAIQKRVDAKLSYEILTSWADRFVDAYDAELQDFIDSIVAGGAPQGPTAWDGYIAAVTADACVKAQTSGKEEPIAIPERPEFYNKYNMGWAE